MSVDCLTHTTSLSPPLNYTQGGAITCDAHHMTDPRADGMGVSTCIELALKDSGLEPSDVNYINAHATSTLVGDVAEVNALKQVFKVGAVREAKGSTTKREGWVVQSSIDTP